ncbi:MAG: hypothetical protein U0529_21350 [Thermoanaerobaculia bacterium]
MGDNRLGPLPRTRRWSEVVDLVGAGASSAAVAAATLDAADEVLSGAADDPTLARSFWLLTQIPDAARSPNFAKALQDLGLAVSDEPSASELTAAFTEAVDREIDSRRARTGPGELAQFAAVESLSALFRDQTSPLFGSSPDEVRLQLGKLGTPARFGQLARSFFARFTERFLSYYISKELPRHIGPGGRFSDLEEQKAFREALATHCGQAARIVEDFAGGWYSKARFEGELSEARARRFLGYAFKKIRGELRRGSV